MPHCDGLRMGPMIYKLVPISHLIMLSREILEYLTSESEHYFSLQKKLPERNLINEVWFEKLQLFFMFNTTSNLLLFHGLFVPPKNSEIMTLHSC